MDWKKLITDLQAAGLNQSQIAVECGCGQATINDLAKGNTCDPRYVLGSKLISLHGLRCGESPPAIGGGKSLVLDRVGVAPQGEGAAHA